MEIRDISTLFVYYAIAFAAWCVRVEMRLSRERQNAAGLQSSADELKTSLKELAEESRHHGEALAAINASMDHLSKGLHDLNLRLERRS
ncbi:MAG: hypothetical protein JSS72_01805 [Armatimonadetes bacterium]|nr:hypothetical protein [Armatimonadota bacterium]